MTQQVDVPGVGIVEFPDTMDDKQIANAIKINILPNYTKAKPESAMPKPVEGEGGAAFGVYRPAGRRPESQQDREASAEMPLQTLRGVASNVTAPLGLPGTIVNQVANLPRTAQDIQNRYQSVRSQLAGNEQQPLPELPEYKNILPGMEWSNTLVPGPEPTSPAGRLAFGGGQLLGSPIMPKAAAMEYNAAKSVLGGAGDIVGGALGRATNYIAKPGEAPVGYQIPSSRIPLGNTFTKPQDWEAFQRGELPYGQLPPETPIQQLPQNWFERQALKASGGEIPAQGKGMRAFGERLGETYRNPLTAAVDVGSAALTGIPLYTAGKAVVAGTQGLADWMLARKGFDPNLPAKMEGYKSGQIPMPVNPQAAQQALQPNPQLRLPAPGPVTPGPMYVSPEGVAGTNISQVSQAGAQQKYAPQPVAQTPEQMAIQKTQEIVNKQVPAQLSPKNQALLDEIRARGSYRPAPAPVAQPVAGPVAPTAIESLPSERWSPAEKLALERAKLQQNPPPAITPAQEAEMAKQGPQAITQSARDIINDYMAGRNPEHGGASTAINDKTQTQSIDLGAIADNKDNVLLGMAKRIVKAGFDSVPEIAGMTQEQVIRMMYQELTGKKAGPKSKGFEVGETKSEPGKLEGLLKKVQETNKETGEVTKLEKPATFKPDPEISILTKQVNPDGSMVLTGTKNGKSITMEVDSGKNVKVLDADNKLIAQYDKSGNKADINVLKKRAPKNVSKMMTPEDTFKALKQDVPRSEMSPTEGKIFDMTQAQRDAFEKSLRDQLPSIKYEGDVKLVKNALELLEKYRFK
jgi:hypothetical protein